MSAAVAAPASAQSVLDAKQPFVANLIQALEAVPGTFGDERARVSAALDGMEAGLRGWDAAIRGYEGGAAAQHDALGVVYLDRGRTGDAIRELTLAGNRRLRALAHDSLGNPRDAASDFAAAWLSEPRDPAAAYLFLFHRPPDVPGARTGEAVSVLTAFAREQPAGAPPAAPFLRLSLLETMPASDPVFLPARYAGAARRLRARDYDGVLQQLRDGWKTDPLNTDAASGSPALATAAEAFRDGRWSDAIAGFETVAREFPAPSESRRLLGTVLWLNGDPARAISALRAALGVNPDDERARVTLADVLVSEKQSDEAERLLRETTAKLPESGEARWRLARVLDTLHRDADALREREAAAALTPVAGEGRALGAIARGYTSAGNLAKAIEAARARVASDLNDAEAHDQLGQIDLQRGSDEDALVELTVASLLDPARAETQAAIAQIHLGAGRYADAIDAARRALANNPKSRQARFALARALLQTGNETEGKKELAAAEQLQIDELERVRQSFATNLVRIEASQREQEGKWDEAAKLRRDVAAKPEASPDDFVRLGEALARSGRHDEAIDVFREALRRDEEPDTYRSLIRELVTAGRAAEAQTTRATYQRVARERFLR